MLQQVVSFLGYTGRAANVAATAKSDPERNSPRHEALRQLLIDRRLRTRMTQTDVARKLGMPQSYVSAADRGSRRVSVID
jgi:hypothetical protein